MGLLTNAMSKGAAAGTAGAVAAGASQDSEAGFGFNAVGDLVLKGWHGGAAGIDKMSTSKIGTGEGEIAFGWGLYQADRRGVGEHYRRLVQRMRGMKKPDGEITIGDATLPIQFDRWAEYKSLKQQGAFDSVEQEKEYVVNMATSSIKDEMDMFAIYSKNLDTTEVSLANAERMAEDDSWMEEGIEGLAGDKDTDFPPFESGWGDWFTASNGQDYPVGPWGHDFSKFDDNNFELLDEATKEINRRPEMSHLSLTPEEPDEYLVSNGLTFSTPGEVLITETGQKFKARSPEHYAWAKKATDELYWNADHQKNQLTYEIKEQDALPKWVGEEPEDVSALYRLHSDISPTEIMNWERRFGEQAPYIREAAYDVTRKNAQLALADEALQSKEMVEAWQLYLHGLDDSTYMKGVPDHREVLDMLEDYLGGPPGSSSSYRPELGGDQEVLLGPGDAGYELAKSFNLMRTKNPHQYGDEFGDALYIIDEALNSKQSQIIQSKADLIKAERTGEYPEWFTSSVDGLSPEILYSDLRKEDSRDLSLSFNDAGVKGLYYEDYGRDYDRSESTFNYVLFEDSVIDIVERGAATAPFLATLGTTSAVAAAGLSEAQEERGFWGRVTDPNTYKAAVNPYLDAASALANSPLGQHVGGNISDVNNAMEMPGRGLQGITRGLFGLASGEDIQTALRNYAEVATSPIEQNAERMEKYLLEKGVHPEDARAGYYGVQLFDPTNFIGP